MKTSLSVFAVMLLAGSLLAQSAAPGASVAAPDEPSLSGQVRELRQMLLQQQQQLDMLRQQMEDRDRQLDRVQEELRLARSGAPAPQATAPDQPVPPPQSVAAASPRAAGSPADSGTPKRALSEGLGPFNGIRFSGDVRVRQEDFFYGCDASPDCNPRIRERIRVRLAVDSKLGQDFLGGVAVVTGALTDPSSDNQTLTSVFERKTIALDRGYISYQPQAHKWLQLWGGKWDYTWTRTPATFDPDLQPEGFSEKLSFDLQHAYLKNFTVNGMQLLFNEDKFLGDSYAAGFQVGTRWALGGHVVAAPAFTLLNWRNTDVVLNEPASVTGGAPGPFGPNGMTNCTTTVASQNFFCSRFLYADFILPVTVATGWDKLPFNLVAEFEQNLNAEPALLVSGGALGPQDKSYSIDLGFGRQKARGDVQFGWEFRRQEQDSVIASFTQSEQRAPTNLLQHRAYFLYKIRNNVQGAYILWVGRTLNTNLVNALRAPGVLPGQADPWLKRMQFDLTYSF